MPTLSRLSNARIFCFFCKNAEQYPEKRHIWDIGRQNVLDRRAAGNQIEALEDHADLAAVAPELFAAQRVHRDTVNGQLALWRYRASG